MTEHDAERQEERHPSEQRYRYLVEAMRDVVFTLSSDAMALTLNPAFESLTGWQRSEWLNRPIWALIHPDDVPLAQEMVQRVMQGETPPCFELRVRTKQGADLITEFTLAPERQHGHVAGVFGIARDMTQRKHDEEAFIHQGEQLQQAQKMEAIGRLAGGIAHDFNNLLTIITGYSQLLLSRLGGGDEAVRSDVEEIKNAAIRAASLTQQLLAFSRSQVLLPKVLSLNTIVDTIDAMLQRLIGEDIHLVTALEPTLGHVKADPGQMEQVIMNLVVNARDAMPRGGRLTIETGNVDMTNSYHCGDAALALGRYAMLAVSDTGCGMDAGTQARIFEPFFTTQGQGKGIGLGLSTVYGIVKQSGGYITVYSEPNRGTTFKIYLPIVDEAIEPIKAEKLSGTLHGDETVLLVEDEPAVRVLVRDTLRLFGYQVLEARHGFEAQSIAHQHTGPIHLLITDVVMPQMSGRELAEGLATEHAHMKVLYMSGYTESAVIHHGVLNPGTAFLQKPFTPETLTRKIREILDINKEQAAR